MSELIGIREAARRLGVSDTAVHKAIKAGRVTVAGRTEKSDRPLVAWPQVETDWLANSDSSKRSHVGGTGKSPAREKYAGTAKPSVKLPTSDQPDQVETPKATVGGDSLNSGQGTGPSFAQSRAVREAYQARLAKLEYEERSGKLVDAAEVKVRAFKMARSARDALMTLPDRMAPILASSTDVVEVHRLMTEDIERLCRRIADEAAEAA